MLHGQIVYVGCCGFPVSRRRYYENYKVVELQNTFYDMPRDEWFESLRKEAPPDFIFSIKAWQVLTHPSKSPTWRRMRTQLPGRKENYGWLKPTEENLRAWERVINAAKILRAKFIILQTPASMPYNGESVRWVNEFFKQIMSVTPKEIVVGWEPRGEWVSERAASDLSKIVSEHKIIHVTDLLKREPVVKIDILYTRLHGLDGEVNYKYKYKDEDLNMLADKLISFGARESYVMFNNIYMFNDGIRFKSIAAAKGIRVY